MSARSLRRRVLCAALAVAGALAGVAVPAHAATDRPGPACLRADHGGLAERAAARRGPARARRSCATTATPRSPRRSAALRLSRFRIASRTEVEAWSSAGTDGLSRTSRVATAPVAAPLAPGASATVDLVVPAAGIRLLDGVRTRGAPAAWWSRRSTGPTASACSARSCSGSPPTTSRRRPCRSSSRPSALRRPPRRRPTTRRPPSRPCDSTATAPGGRLHALSTAIATDRDIGVAVDPALLAAAGAGTPRTRPGPRSSPTPSPRTTSSRCPGRTRTSSRPRRTRTRTTSCSWPSTGPHRPGVPGLATTTGLLWAPGRRPAGPGDRGRDLAGGRRPPRAAVRAPTRTPLRRPTPAARRARPRARSRRSARMRRSRSCWPRRRRSSPVRRRRRPSQRTLAELAVISRESSEPAAHAPRARAAPGSRTRRTSPRCSPRCSPPPGSGSTSVSTLLDATDDPGAHLLPADSATNPAELAPTSVDALADARERAVAFASVTSEPAILLDGVDAEVLAPLAVAWRDGPGRPRRARHDGRRGRRRPHHRASHRAGQRRPRRRRRQRAARSSCATP